MSLSGNLVPIGSKSRGASGGVERSFIWNLVPNWFQRLLASKSLSGLHLEQRIEIVSKWAAFRQFQSGSKGLAPAGLGVAAPSWWLASSGGGRMIPANELQYAIPTQSPFNPGRKAKCLGLCFQRFTRIASSSPARRKTQSRTQSRPQPRAEQDRGRRLEPGSIQFQSSPNQREEQTLRPCAKR